MDHLPHDTRYTFWYYLKLDEREGETILGHSRKTDMAKLYKTPELKHLHKVLAQLRFDVSIEENNDKPIAIEVPTDDVDDLKKMKADMQKLGFTSMKEYMEYLEFKKLKQRL